MKSKVIQAIRQTDFAIISYLSFFPFSEVESKKQFTQATHVMHKILEKQHNTNTSSDRLQGRATRIHHADHREVPR